jgi:protoporphyrinogen oxidase
MGIEQPHVPEILVLGGGLSGLSAAAALLRRTPSCRVTVLEKEDRPGGLARSIMVGGVVSDLGPHRIYSTIPEMREWFRTELEGDLIEVHRVSRMFAAGRLLHYPPQLLEVLSAFGLRRFLGFMGGYASARARMLAGGLGAYTFADLMERSFGRPLCEALVFPYIRKVWKLEPEEVSGDVARVRARDANVWNLARRVLTGIEKEGSETSVKKFLYLKGGVETAVRHLAASVERAGGRIECRCEVRGVEMSGRRIAAVEVRDGYGKDRRIAADFVFSTIPITELAGAMHCEALDEARQAVRDLKFLRMLLTFLVIKRPNVTADHWLYFPEASPSITRAYESKNFDPESAPENRTVMCVEHTATEDDPDWNLEDGRLARRALEQFAGTGLIREDEALDAQLHRITHGYPVYRVGYERILKRALDGLARVENLIPLGRQGLFQHNNMDHAIYSGIRAAACWTEKRDDAVAEWYEREIPAFRDFRIVD